MIIHDASQFAALSGPAFITGFALRPDAMPGPTGPQTLNLQIYASTTSRPVAGLSNTFADNLGADNTLVFDGTLTQRTANLPGPGNTRQFDVAFSFTTPFRYDPRGGNLLLDFQIFSVSGVLQRDLVSGDPSVSTLVGPSPTATAGSVLGAATVGQFTVQPVPEPSAFALVSLGGLGLLGSARRWWKRV
jgi:hypothetical protein